MDVTVGKMPMPLYTTAMVWDSDFNPEGAAERFKYTVGEADFFGTFGQFLYSDVNPSFASPGFGFNNALGGLGQKGSTVFQLAWQGGLNYHLTTNLSAKIAATLYNYIGVQSNNLSPFFGDSFVGQGAYLGPGSADGYVGDSGYSSGAVTPYQSLGFANNQVGLNHLMVVEVPFEVNLKLRKVDVRVFGDFAYNLDGKKRAEDAQASYAYFLANSQQFPATIRPFGSQTKEVKAYQLGVSVASSGNVGMVYGSVCKRNGWEIRGYWQHVEQYALDPNLLDSDFFEGRGNLQGFYSAIAYGFSDNILATVRYGYASRINNNLGTGGSNQDIPQMNPIGNFRLLQMDLTFRF